MTKDQQSLQRMQVWERYENAKRNLLACRSQLRGWEDTFTVLASRLKGESVEQIREDYVKVPSLEIFLAGIEEFELAKLEYSRCVEETRRNGFPT
jgi:hypothetical protein